MKGQWFIISAVVASSVFFGLSVLMKDYFVVDSSDQAAVNNDYHFYNIIGEFDKIVATTRTNVSCVNLTSNLDELKNTVEKSLGAKGYFVSLEYGITPPCTTGSNIVKIDLLVATDKQVIYNFSSYSSAGEILGAA